MSFVEHKVLGEAYKSHLETLRKALQSGRWMGAMWRVVDGKLEFLGKTTWDFPTGDFDAAVQQLQADCDAEKERLVDPGLGSVLPLADFLKNTEEDLNLGEEDIEASQIPEEAFKKTGVSEDDKPEIRPKLTEVERERVGQEMKKFHSGTAPLAQDLEEKP